MKKVLSSRFFKIFLFANILVVLLFLVCLIPGESLRSNVIKSFPNDTSFNNSSNLSLDDFNADAVAFNIMMADGKFSLVDNVFKAYRFGEVNTLKFIFQLKSYLYEDCNDYSEYIQYWHGYRVLWKPLLLFLDRDKIECLVFLAYLIAFLVVGHKFIKEKDYYLVLALSIVNIIFIFLGGFCTLEYIPIYFITLIGITLVYTEKCDYIVLFSCLGISTAFFDFLTAETLTFTLPFFILLYKNKAKFSDFLKCGFSWFLSYIGMFLYKYILMCIIYKENFFSKVVQIYKRDFVYDTMKVDRLNAIRFNLIKLVGDNMWGYFILIFILFVLAYLFRSDKITASSYVISILLFIIPYVRYYILFSHSFNLWSFTYRAQMIDVLIIFLLFKYIFFKRRKERNYVKT